VHGNGVGAAQVMGTGVRRTWSGAVRVLPGVLSRVVVDQSWVRSLIDVPLRLRSYGVTGADGSPEYHRRTSLLTLT
jgi:hypothetical protein